MLKKILVLFTLLFSVLAIAYDLPGFREVNGLQVHILPDKIGEEVVFTFDKQDINGYSGSDAVVYSISSPSNKVVWEETIPDDGSEANTWKEGPRQSVKCRFKATEPGIYCLKANTASSVDMKMYFDHSTIQNGSWALAGTRFRSADGPGKFDALVLLAPHKLGEKRIQTFQVTTTPRSHVTQLTVLAGEKTLVPVQDLEHQPKKEALRYRKFPIERLADEDIYEIRASSFCDVAPYQFPQYGEFLLFAERRFAEKFRTALCQIDTDNYLELPAPAQNEEIAFARGVTYQLEFAPQRKTDFDFELSLFNQKYRFSSQKSQILITVPKNCSYTPVDLSSAPAGKLLVTRVTNIPSTILPPSGAVMNGTEELLWTAHPSTRKYTIKLTNLSDKQTTTLSTSDNRLPLATAKKLTPGLWQWQIAAEEGQFGCPAFFIIPQKADTALLYFHDFFPARDSIAGKNLAKIAVQFDGKTANDLNLAKSRILINDKAYPLEILGTNTIGLSKIPLLRDGYNTITVTILDNNSNLSQTQWGFFGTEAKERKLSYDERGNIFFNGLPFFPLIYYGYKPNQPLERLGFNTLLLNTLPSQASLDLYLKRNLKALDSGSVYHGFYSKGSTPEADVQKFIASPAAIHQARLASWMDEMDMHWHLPQIKKFLALFGSKEKGWRGVCSCNRSLYKTMAEYGDYLMIDCYAHGKNLFVPDQYTVQGRQAAGKKPLMLLVSGFSSIDPALTGFIPTPKEVEYAAFSALRNRVNALGLYQCGSYRMECYPGAWKVATTIYKRLDSLSFVLYGKEADKLVSVESQNNQVSLRALKFANHLYLIVQNPSFTPTTATFRLRTSANNMVKVLFENRAITAQNGKFMDGFGAADTHVYAIELR